MIRFLSAGAAILFVAVMSALPLFDSAYLITHSTRILIYAIMAMSLDLLVGYCGLVSLGHAAFFGLSAYTAAMLSAHAGIGNVLIGLPLSLLSAAAGALIIGVLTLRTDGIYFIMATLAFAQMLFFLANDSDFFGGSDGLLLLNHFRASIGNVVLFDLSEPTTRYYVVLAAAFATCIGLALMVRSPFGRVLQGIKSNTQRMRALGYPVERYKLACFVIGGTLSGLAGYLYLCAHQPGRSLDPELDAIRRGADDGSSWRDGHAHRAGRRRVRAHRAGRSKLRPDRALEADSRCCGDSRHALCARWACRPGWDLACAPAGGEARVSDNPILLEARALSKRFGSLAAVRDVSIEFLQGEVHAIIGPNGAGKTTFLNLVSGELPATSGALYLNGEDVTGWTADRLARAGLGRSFQHSSVFENLSVHENVRLAAQTQFPQAFGLLLPAERYAEVNRRVDEVLLDMALAASTAARAGEISHGEQRQLEIAMLLAISPKVMLLDEPTSGMSRNETLAMIEVLRRVSRKRTLVLVEHDMEVVFELADRITVLVNGAVLASGAPDKVREDAAVRAAYLGPE